MVTNVEIRKAAKERGVKLWEIANRIGVNDGNFSRKLRKELSFDEKNRILAVVDEIAASRDGGKNESEIQTG